MTPPRDPITNPTIDDLSDAARDEDVPVLGPSDNSDSGSDSLGPRPTAEGSADDAIPGSGAFGLPADGERGDATPAGGGPLEDEDLRERGGTRNITQGDITQGETAEDDTLPLPSGGRDEEQEDESADPVGDPQGETNIEPDGSPVRHPRTGHGR